MAKNNETISHFSQWRPTPEDVAVIYEKNGKETVTAGVNRGMTVEDAEDATQEGAIRAIVGLGTYTGAAPLEHWYSVTQYNARIDYFRGGRVRREREVTGEDELLAARIQKNKESPAISPSAEELVLHSDDWIRIHESINCLEDDGQLEAVTLFAKGLSYEEMAEQLEVPKGTVKSRVSRGLRKVRSVFFRESSSE